MTMSSRTSFVTHEAFSLVSIYGPIDEHFVVPSMALDDPSRPIIIDTANVSRLNSFGLRTWLLWISELSKAERPLLFVRCPPTVVTQANYVANFLGSGYVLSFYAPYACPKCGESLFDLVDLRDSSKAHFVPKTVHMCGSCDLPLELTELEEDYFAFVERGAGFSAPEDFWTLLGAVLDRIPRTDDHDRLNA